MFSDTEEGTRAALETDLALEADRTAQIEAKDAAIVKAEAESNRIAAVLAKTHQQIVAVKAAHELLEARIYDALIDAGEADSAIDASSIESDAALIRVCVGKLQRVTEVRQPAQRLKVLALRKERAVLILDRAGIRSRVHASQLLLAVLPAGAIGGDLSIKSEMGARLAHEESQAGYDLEQANAALQREIEQQQKIRGARAMRGPITFTNPS